MKTEMSEADVVKVLLGKDGWQDGIQKNGHLRYVHEEDYLTSHDSLRPVLAKLTEEEWDRLNEQLEEIDMKRTQHGIIMGWSKLLLTLDPKTIAYAIAEAIQGGKQ